MLEMNQLELRKLQLLEAKNLASQPENRWLFNFPFINQYDDIDKVSD